MKFLIVFATIILAINAATDQEQWQAFKQKYGRQYRNLKEEQQRFSVFQSSLRTIEEHNEKYARGEKSYYMGVNQFADRTISEYRSLLTYNATRKPASKLPVMKYQLSGLQAPESVNWVSQGVVTEIKDQMDCGSCWAFSAAGTLESAYALSTGTLVSLSEQNLIDCDSVSDGCEGGWKEAGYNYVADNGIERESDYAYTMVKGTCQFSQSLSVFSISGFVHLDESEDVLLDAVANVQPIGVAVNANSFIFYAGGVFDESSCDGSSDALNHEVIVVGYGAQNGVDYWLVKNSWGLNWGESGYIKMARNKGNQCGIANDASYPVL